MVPLVCSLAGLATVASAQTSSKQPTAKDIRGPVPVVPPTSEPAPRLIVDPPLAEPLSFGRVVVQ
ncbi:MAG TPA: DUF6130 family protein, partial [Chitinophagaceae bacterium]|nr:DUF6130 family protein [Chitinophagaceae bacterium]